MIVKITLSIIVIIFFAINVNAQDRGSICIDKMPGNQATPGDPPMTAPEIFIAPGSTLMIQVDSLPAVIVSPQQASIIKDISLNGRHIVKIKIDNKLKTSFKFKFTKREHSLCLWYYKGYGTFSLRPAKECQCKDQ